MPGLRLDNWRIVYVVDEQWEIITVLAVRINVPRLPGART
jgi:hypothetical protein